MVMARAPGGPRNSYEVVLGLRGGPSERLAAAMMRVERENVCEARYRSASPSRVGLRRRGPRAITFHYSLCTPSFLLSPSPRLVRCTALVLMGFFSSRRHDTDVLSNSSNAQSPSSSPSSGIIRSRFVRTNAAYVFLPLRPHTSLIIRSMEQYGRNKGKAREADPTPTRVTSPLAAAEPRMEPNLNDTPRTTNGHRAMDDSGSGSRDTFESSLHSPAPQQASMSPDAASARASTDAITHVSPSTVTHSSLLMFFFSGLCLHSSCPNWPPLTRLAYSST
jgi:hypothetical protein